MDEPVRVLASLTRELEALEIPYLVGGSFASSVFGTPRSTQDADVVADIPFDRVEPLHRRLSPEFFVDLAMMRSAVSGQGSFNVLHHSTMFKIDVFVSPHDEWSLIRLQRARTESVETTAGPVTMRFSSPEDTLLHKLIWCRLGNEVSDRQWEDVVGLLKVQAGTLDGAYLDRWAPVLGVAHLLARARQTTK